jgi:hypothetical protein
MRNGANVLPDAKTAGLQAAGEWGEDGTDDVPLHVILQLSLYGRVTRLLGWEMAPAAEVPALIGGDFRLYVVPYDDELGQATEAAAERFWVDHVEPRRPPPPSEPSSDSRGLNTLYRQHRSDALDYATLPESAREIVRIWAKAVAARKDAVKAEQAAEVHLKALMGETAGVDGLPEELGRRIDWRKNTDGTSTDWKEVAEEMAHKAHEGPVSPAEYKAIVARHTRTTQGARPLVLRERKK